MKKLEKLFINKMNAKVLSQQEMKFLKGGGVYCHCMGESGSRSAGNCGECPGICGTNGVQNCNYVN